MISQLNQVVQYLITTLAKCWKRKRKRRKKISL